jgi:nucleoside-diphosphate-sugar epimerase
VQAAGAELAEEAGIQGRNTAMTQQRRSGEEPVMGEDRLHVVFGTGQVGNTLTAHLARLGIAVRAVSRHRPPALAGVDWRAADAADPEAAADAAKGASVIYQCLNAPYTQWPERFPPLQRGVLAAAERTGALLVSLENLYGYGPTSGQPMTEDLPLAAAGVKGRARAAMTAELLAAADAGRVRIAIGRASDFFGPGVTAGSTLGERVFGNALAGRRADFIGNPDLPHTYSYVPDIAAGLATLGTDARAVGEVWHLPGPATGTTRALLDLLAAEVGYPVGVRSVPKLAMRALALVNPTLRELAEMSYEFDQPFVLDTSKYESVRGGRHPAGRRHRRDRGLVPDPDQHAMTTKSEAGNAMTTPLITVTPKPAALNAADLTPAAAWSRRVRRIGGFIQAAFAALWLGRAAWPSAAAPETS